MLGPKAPIRKYANLLNNIHKSFFDAVEAHDTHEYYDQHEADAVPQIKPRKSTLANEAVFEGFNHGRHGVDHGENSLFGRYFREGPNDRSRKKPQLNAELYKEKQVPVLRRQRSDDQPKPEGQPCCGDYQKGKQQRIHIWLNKWIGEQKVEVKQQEHDELYAELHEVVYHDRQR
jgi:hypothetical protein